MLVHDSSVGDFRRHAPVHYSHPHTSYGRSKIITAHLFYEKNKTHDKFTRPHAMAYRMHDFSFLNH